MLQTYPAVLRDGRLEWTGEVPKDLPAGAAVPVHVTLLPAAPPLSDAERGRRMADALEKIAALGGVQSIPDSVAWQKEIRQDRPLPGRES